MRGTRPAPRHPVAPLQRSNDDCHCPFSRGRLRHCCTAKFDTAVFPSALATVQRHCPHAVPGHVRVVNARLGNGGFAGRECWCLKRIDRRHRTAPLRYQLWATSGRGSHHRNCHDETLGPRCRQFAAPRGCRPAWPRLAGPQRDAVLMFSPKNFQVLPSNFASLNVSKVE